MEVVETTGAIRPAKLQSNCHHQQTNTQLFLQAGCPPCLLSNSVRAQHCSNDDCLSSTNQFCCVCVQMSVTCKRDMSCLSVSVLTTKRDIVSYFVNSFSCCERAMLYCWQNSVTSGEIYLILPETFFFWGGDLIQSVTPNQIHSHEFLFSAFFQYVITVCSTSLALIMNYSLVNIVRWMVINFEAGCSGNTFVAITELIIVAEACPLLLLLMQQLIRQ